MVDGAGFIRAAQGRTARIAASASATRRQGRGAVIAARHFFSALDLRRLGVSTGATFRSRLDEVTVQLRDALPRNARSWGLARKLLNIFLRDALYTTYLCERFGLARAEQFLEIPLDSITARRLRKHAGRGVLPRWKGVKHLTLEASDKYQCHAERVAQDSGLARVHLDTYWWGERDDEAAAQPRAAARTMRPPLAASRSLAIGHIGAAPLARRPLASTTKSER